MHTPIRGFDFPWKVKCSLVSNLLNQPIRFLEFPAYSRNRQDKLDQNPGVFLKSRQTLDWCIIFFIFSYTCRIFLLVQIVVLQACHVIILANQYLLLDWGTVRFDCMIVVCLLMIGESLCFWRLIFRFPSLPYNLQFSIQWSVSVKSKDYNVRLSSIARLVNSCYFNKSSNNGIRFKSRIKIPVPA